MRLPAVLALQAVMQGFKALRVQKVQKGAKKGRACCHRQTPSQLEGFHTELALDGLPYSGWFELLMFTGWRVHSS